METNKPVSGLAALSKEARFFHPGFSIDCVIFGFHKGKLKVLLTNYKGFDFWMLPGSFVLKDENVDVAAHRILHELTGLKKLYLQQFYLFGDADRRIGMQKGSQEVFKDVLGITIDHEHWFHDRFITMGYYALVDYTKAKITPLSENERAEWKEVDSGQPTYADHQAIVRKALETIRFSLGLVPIGHELLPEKFTMTELRVLYETILGRPLNRRNFERKAISLGYIIKLDEKRKGVAYKAPSLFSFDKKKYKQAQTKSFHYWF